MLAIERLLKVPFRRLSLRCAYRVTSTTSLPTDVDANAPLSGSYKPSP